MKLARLFLLPCILAFGVGANCTPEQVLSAADQVAVDICQEAPQFLPPNTDVGHWVAIVCGIIDPKTGAPLKGSRVVVIDKSQWNAMKLVYQTKHGSLPGGMSPAAAP